MIYTKERLESMSDLMINEAMALEYGLLVAQQGHGVYSRGYRENYPSTIWVAKHKKHEQTGPWEQVNYCNDPSDIMPLVEECNISLVSNQKGYTAISKAWRPQDSIDSHHEKYGRAAAIVYILIKQEEL